MTHLSDERALAVFGGNGSAAEREHLAGCEQCRQDLSRWEFLLADLDELEREQVDARELHVLSSLFRELGPASGRAVLTGRLRSSSAVEPAIAAVRGPAGAVQMFDFEAGPYRVLLQVLPQGGSRFDVHGQVTDERGEPAGRGRVVLGEQSGVAAEGPIDEFGEFHLEHLAGGVYRGTWWLQEHRIDFLSLLLGEADDG
ncbi:MAG: carboxypeptidase-like regulatory domain-containing protein [Acidobacteria bacterium]|nr:carboxypeptidase-like regulatory domain-containing protein [Acidobacteriota bacterium]